MKSSCSDVSAGAGLRCPRQKQGACLSRADQHVRGRTQTGALNILSQKALMGDRSLLRSGTNATRSDLTPLNDRRENPDPILEPMILKKISRSIHMLLTCEFAK
jgi:hypothetical protein